MGVSDAAEAMTAMCASGRRKAGLPADILLVSGFMAGAYVAFGGFLALVASAGAPWPSGIPGLQRLIYGAMFPLGVILTVLAGGELFTGNCLSLTVAGLDRGVRPCGVLRNWVLSYAGNFLGAVAVAYFLGTATGILVKDPWATYLLNIATAKCSLTFQEAFWRGVGSNWLVCLAVWMAARGENAVDKVVAIQFPIMAFVTLGFENSIANMFTIPAALFALGSTADVSWGTLLIRNLIPVTLGNIVGGAVFVGCLFWYIHSRERSSLESERTDERRKVQPGGRKKK